MPSIRISKAQNNQPHFLTFTIKDWICLFDRHDRWELLADSLIYCQKHKYLKIYGYIFMINHIHLIWESPCLDDLIRDFKSINAKKLMKNINQTEPKILDLFKLKNGKYQFWQKTNMPELLYSDDFFNQKLNYIHNNPVRKQYVAVPEHWYWSSALFYYVGKQGIIHIDDIVI